MISVASPGVVVPISPFGNVPVSERTPQIELKSTYGLSELRDSVVETNGTVTHDGPGQSGEYELVTTATASAVAQLDSVERGRYVPGASAEAGIGVRLSSVSFTGEQVARWGLFDDDNGFGFYRKAGETGVFVRRGGVDTDTSSWNVDPLDGSGRSGATLDLTEGTIFQVHFAWYGYGVIEWQVLLPDPVSGKQKNIPLHRFSPTGETSTLNPNLPLRAEVRNGATATASPTVFVGGRQFSILGRYVPTLRTTAGVRRAVGSVGSTDWVPLVSFRRKTAYESVSVRPAEYSILVAGADVELQARTNMTLTSPSWGALTDTTATETALEMDTAGTITADLSAGAGEAIWYGIHPAGQGQRSTITTSGLSAALRGLEPVTYLVRSLSGTATVSLVARFAEEW